MAADRTVRRGDEAVPVTTPAFAVARSTLASRIGAVVSAVLLVALATLPLWGNASLMRMLIEFISLLVLAQMWNLLAGYAGLVSIGQQAYVGLGGYAIQALKILGIDLHFPLNRTSDDLVLMPGETADSSLADVDAKAARARIDPERAGCRRGPERHQQEGAVDARGHTSDPDESSPALQMQGSRQGHSHCCLHADWNARPDRPGDNCQEREQGLSRRATFRRIPARHGSWSTT